MSDFLDNLGDAAQHEQRYYGPYRAWVVDNVDPEQQDRLRVRVPEVSGDLDAWAIPSWPAGSTPEGHHLPDAGTEVWVEFEGGDPTRPIWTGQLH